MNRLITIYALQDPRDESIRYVGQSRNMRDRMNTHFQPKGMSPKTQWVRELATIGMQPVVLELEQVAESVSTDRERFYIKHFAAKGEPLTNVQFLLTPGPDTIRHYRPGSKRARKRKCSYPGCDNVIEGRRKDALYCSNGCRNKASKERRVLRV